MSLRIHNSMAMGQRATVRNSRFVGVLSRHTRPTLKHRPAIWENMLGTVYAMNDDGEVRYFDYRHDEARAFAGIPNGDHAAARNARSYRYTPELKERYRGMFHKDTSKEPRLRQMVLWVKMEEID